MADLFKQALGTAESPPRTTRRRSARPVVLLSWRRMIVRVNLVLRSAFFQRLSSGLLAMAGVSPPPTMAASASGGKSSQASARPDNSMTPLHQQHGVSYMIGARLPDGPSKGTRDELPADCSHPPEKQKAGGNGSMYYQKCIQCYARWQRIPVVPTTLDPPSMPSAAEAETTGGAPTCPECATKNMVIRVNRSTKSHFWGCRLFPRCRGTKYLDQPPARVAVSAPAWGTYRLDGEDSDIDLVGNEEEFA